MSTICAGAMRLVAREAVRLLDVRLVAVGVPDEFAGVDRYEVAEGPAAETFDTSARPARGLLRRAPSCSAGVAIHVDGRRYRALGELRLGKAARRA